MEVDNWIQFYFRLGFKYKEILAELKCCLNITMSMKTLKRKLKKLNLYRRKNKTGLDTLVNFLMDQEKTCGQLQGYRWMHLKCLQEGLVVDRETVRIAKKLINPAAVEMRKKRRLQRRSYKNFGPNYLWHMDGYDKIKPYGIAIHGVIDGYSRYILWLHAGPTNNDPAVIGKFFLDKLKELEGCPKTVRSDLGTENGTVEFIQKTVRAEYGLDSQRPPFLYGKSPANQRIESFWAQLRKHISQFFMNFFEELTMEGFFERNIVDESLVRFCFTSLVQKELDNYAREWNTHRIRKTKNCVSPTGARPLSMYFSPELYGGKNHLIPIDDVDRLDIFEQACTKITNPCNEIVYELSMIIMKEQGKEMPENLESAKNLYLFLRNEIEELLT